jgi:hypothetical protein
MSRRKTISFFTIRTEGAILPSDLLQRIAEGDKALPGLKPTDYYLAPSEKLGEAVSRSWNRLVALWRTFRGVTSESLESVSDTGPTRERWLLPLFQELGYERLPVFRQEEKTGKSFPISHFKGSTPIHLVGFRVDLDRRTPGVAGAARSSPHSLVQEFLNQSESCLWGFVSNGLNLRILRDNARLTRQAFVEFDLEAMFDGEVFADFTLLWLLCHWSRVEADHPEDCWLEKWSKISREEGARALDQLRDGVESAIAALGCGFLAHPANGKLRESLRTGALNKQEYYRQLLRLVYRLIFLCVAEDRELLPNPDGDQTARNLYHQFYSVQRLRDLAGRHRGNRHSDLYETFRLVGRKLGDAAGCSTLALTPLGGMLWSEQAISALGGRISNADFLRAIRALSFRASDGALRPVDFRNLGAEELGSVYESLLELHPDLNTNAGTFQLQTAAGHERKTTGSYYTPDSLVQCLLDSALEPVMADAIHGKQGESAAQAILNLKICDPAVGSGHFLIAAAHRMARRVAAFCTGDEEPSPVAIRSALRDVIGHSLYGVDINPMAAELCKVGLWMEAMVPNKPLSFLDHHIRVGNSLLGTTPELMAKGIPDEAFAAVEGDDRSFASTLKKLNKTERNQMSLPLAAEDEAAYGDLAERVTYLDGLDDASIEGVQEKQESYTQLNTSQELCHPKLLADAWCSAFFWKKRKDTPQAVTEDVFRGLRKPPPAAPRQTISEIHRFSNQCSFFHWHLAFPEVFAKGGFDCVLGNPPWERIQPEALLFFAESHPELLSLKRSERNREIEKLAETDPAIFQAWRVRRRADLDVTKYLKSSGCFPLSTMKNVNSYAVFQELALRIMSNKGSSGLILQSGIATDDINKDLFRQMISTGQLTSLFDFENRLGLFVDVHRMMKFCLLTCRGKDSFIEKSAPRFVFNALRIDELKSQDRVFELSADELSLLSPNTGLCPTFRSRADADLVLHLYRQGGAFVRESIERGNPWSVSIRRIFSMAYDGETFFPKPVATNDADIVRVYEAKLLHQFDHRYATYNATSNDTQDCVEFGQSNARPDLLAQPRLFASKAELMRRIPEGDWPQQYLLAYRDVTNAANERTCIACILPKEATDDTIRILFPRHGNALDHACLLANFNSFILDYAARNCVASTHLSEYLAKQLPVLPPYVYAGICPWGGGKQLLRDWLSMRVLELTYTAFDLQPFSEDCGWPGLPFHWDEERRFLLRCEIDAAFFHLYLPTDINKDWLLVEHEAPRALVQLTASFATPRTAVAYIMDTFPIVRRRNEEEHNGDYRIKRVILEIYDAMQESIRTGHPYQTRLDPPPADPRCCHPQKEERP